jgi:hypothetical protein
MAVVNLAEATLSYLKEASWRAMADANFIDHIIIPDILTSRNYYLDKVEECKTNIAKAEKEIHDCAMSLLDETPSPLNLSREDHMLQKLSKYGIAREKRHFYECYLKQSHNNAYIEAQRIETEKEKIQSLDLLQSQMNDEIRRRRIESMAQIPEPIEYVEESPRATTEELLDDSESNNSQDESLARSNIWANAASSTGPNIQH